VALPISCRHPPIAAPRPTIYCAGTAISRPCQSISCPSYSISAPILPHFLRLQIHCRRAANVLAAPINPFPAGTNAFPVHINPLWWRANPMVAGRQSNFRRRKWNGWHALRQRIEAPGTSGQGEIVERARLLARHAAPAPTAASINSPDAPTSPRHEGKPIVMPVADTSAASWFRKVDPPVPVQSGRQPQEKWSRAWREAIQLLTALLVPVATLASQSISEASIGNWWQLVAIGFASDTIKTILIGRPESATGK
jgi:hypothetical protein